MRKLIKVIQRLFTLINEVALLYVNSLKSKNSLFSCDKKRV